MSLTSALPSTINLKVARDSDTTLEFTLTDQDGTAVDLTGARTVFTVATGRRVLASSAQIRLVNATGEHQTATAGKTRFKITKALSNPATGVLGATGTANWIYDLRREDSAGDETVHAEGFFVIKSYPSRRAS